MSFNEDRNKLIFIIVSITSLIVIGTIGYIVLLDISFIDALYMTIITISTVGYKEVTSMTDAAQVFSIIVILWGLATVGYTFTTLIVMIVDGKIRNMWRNRVVEKRISNLKKHYIICGSTGSASAAIRQLKKEKKRFVVIESSQEIYQKLLEEDILCILGESTEIAVLERANIDEAIGLISARSSDAKNIVTVLTARYAKNDLFIISEVIEEKSRGKLMRAGANNTVSGSEIGGKRMASIMTRPSVISFLDVTTKIGDIELDLEDILINKMSEADGKSLKELKIPARTGLTVLAVKLKGESDLRFNPNPDKTFCEGDIMLVLGTAKQVNKLRTIAGDKGDRLPELPC